MSEDKISGKYKQLLSGGPATAETLGGHPPVDARRIYDIRKFNPKDQTEAIWHLADHPAERVLRLWLATNQDRLAANNITRRSLSYTLSAPHAEVWREIKDEDQYDWLGSDEGSVGGANETEPQSCPNCTRDDIKNLPRHLRGCNGGDDDTDS